MKNKIKLIVYSILILFAFQSTDVFSAGSASLFINKPTQNVLEGDSVTLEVRVKSPAEAINAVSGALTFPSDLLQTVSISRDKSILNIWTHDPSITRNKISFEGVILNPGYKGNGTTLFNVTFIAKKSGTAKLSFSEGSLLANDGLGTNILNSLDTLSFNIGGGNSLPIDQSLAYSPSSTRQVALPVITDYSQSVFSKDSIYLKGQGEPNAMTKISFNDTSVKSLGERFMEYLQTKKKRLEDVLVKNDKDGSFQYFSQSNLVAGAYNATPLLIDTNKNTEQPGLGVQLLVKDSNIVRYIVILINVLGLLIPVVGLIVIIYFIPWYSFLRMRILKKKIGLEEEQIEITEHELKRHDLHLDKESKKE